MNPPRRRPVHAEGSLQAWADRFIDKVVLEPKFTSGIDHAQIDMQSIGRRQSVQARGIKFGLPDLFVCQAPAKILWIELKRGSQVSSAQEGVHAGLRRVGQLVAVCRSIGGILASLRYAGFALHLNADNIAYEYETRVEASIAQQRARAPKPIREMKPRPFPSQEQADAMLEEWLR